MELWLVPSSPAIWRLGRAHSAATARRVPSGCQGVKRKSGGSVLCSCNSKKMPWIRGFFLTKKLLQHQHPSGKAYKRIDLVVYTVAFESKGRLFNHWKQAITEPLSTFTMELYGTEVIKSFANTVEHSRQQTFASNLQEIRRKREMRRQLEHEEALLEEENRVLFTQQGPDV